jgi:hypothetical protein
MSDSSGIWRLGSFSNQYKWDRKVLGSMVKKANLIIGDRKRVVFNFFPSFLKDLWVEKKKEEEENRLQDFYGQQFLRV